MKFSAALILALVFVANSFAENSSFDMIDPRLPSHEQSLLFRIKVSEGYTHNYADEYCDSIVKNEFNRKLFDHINKPRDYILTHKDDNLNAYISLIFEEDWIGVREDDINYSNLQSSLIFKGYAKIKDKIEFEHEVKIFKSDSTLNLSNASSTGEFLKDPMLSYNFPSRGAATSDSYVIEVQTDKALIKGDVYGIKLQIGRDRPQFKSGYRSGLLVSGLARPIDMFYRIDYKYWIIGYTALAGQLTDAGDRYISLKRIYFQFARWLQIGGTEGVAYREEPLAYFNPMLFIYFVNRHRVDNDDNIIAVYDISVTPIKSLNIFLEFLNDDLKLSSDTAPSKYGFSAGFLKTGFIWEKLDIRAEYTQVRKWTYSHVSEVNAWEYRNWPLGFWLGTDADEFYAKADYLLSPETSVSLSFNYVRNGEGDLYLPYEQEGGDVSPEFPSGTVEKSAGGWLDFRHEFNYFEIRGRVGYRLIKNRNNEPGECDSFFTHWGVSYTL